MCINNYWGILFHHSIYCAIINNLLQENEGYGLELIYDSHNNNIHHNAFVDNNLGGTSQAYDDCNTNYWYDSATQEGNYWSDWSGTGSYSIDGDADSVDLYPLDEPIEYTVVISTTDETQLFFTFTLLIAVVPLILMKLFSRKRRKID